MKFRRAGTGTTNPFGMIAPGLMRETGALRIGFTLRGLGDCSREAAPADQGMKDALTYESG